METDPGVLTHRIAIKVDDTEQSVKNVRRDATCMVTVHTCTYSVNIVAC